MLCLFCLVAGSFYRDAFMRCTKKEWRLQVIIGAPRLGSGDRKSVV